MSNMHVLFFLLLLFLLNNQRRCQEKLQQATYKTQGLWLEHKHVPGPTSDDRAGQQAMQNTLGWLQIQMHNVDRTTDLRHHSDHRLGRALSSSVRPPPRTTLRIWMPKTSALYGRRPTERIGDKSRIVAWL